MGPGSAGLRLNSDAIAACGFFTFYAAVGALSLLYLGPFRTVTTPLHPLAGATAIFVYALVGYRAARAFGGRANFTGRLLDYYALALLVSGLSWAFWGLFAGGSIPSGPTLIALGVGGVGGQVLASLALFVSARAVLVKLNTRTLGMILVSVVPALILSYLLFVTLTTPADRILWSGIWSVAVFVQLACSLILVSSLGSWYLARPIVNIAFAYLGLTIGSSVVTILRLALQFNEADYWIILSVIQAVSFFGVGLWMSQTRPPQAARRTPDG
jgi:hypothetical protein